MVFSMGERTGNIWMAEWINRTDHCRIPLQTLLVEVGPF
jgi:hypothetical protein